MNGEKMENKLSLKQLAQQRHATFMVFASKKTYQPRKQRIRKGGKK